MSKEKRARALADNEAKAIAKMLRISPQKLNLVAGLIRGKKVASALADLQFSRKRIAVDVKKCLESAIANAENNHDLDVDDLVVAQAFVGKAIVSPFPVTVTCVFDKAEGIEHSNYFGQTKTTDAFLDWLKG